MENQRVTKQMARFVVMYDTPSDIEAFERHYREVHIPLAKKLPGLRRYTVIEAGNKTAEDAITNLSRVHHDSRHDRPTRRQVITPALRDADDANARLADRLRLAA